MTATDIPKGDLQRREGDWLEEPNCRVNASGTYAVLVDVFQRRGETWVVLEIWADTVDTRGNSLRGAEPTGEMKVFHVTNVSLI